ncbi:MAG: hypothetical protein JST08_12045 [Actinobacteria bacterium]|nr:hypothetical protein [Actinomycetota bacterium]
MERTRNRRGGGSQVEAGALAVLIVLGCQVLWLGVPVGMLWLLTRLTGDPAAILIAGLVAMPPALAGVAWMLAAADRRYLRLVGDRGGRRRGPLEVALPASITIGLVTALVWFAFFANHMPAGHEQLIP